MEMFWKAAAAVLIALILCLALGKQERDIGVLLTIAVCCMTGMTAITFLEPILDLLRELEMMTQLDGNMLAILLKLVGIGLVSEIVGTICSDAGCGSLGKSLQMLASAAMLYLSIPIFKALLTLIREILGVL